METKTTTKRTPERSIVEAIDDLGSVLIEIDRRLRELNDTMKRRLR